MNRWIQRAALLALGSVSTWAMVGTADVVARQAQNTSARTVALQSSARAQWALVYWQRRQARALEAACEPAWVSE